MELLAIPLGGQNAAAKWLVMRRCTKGTQSAIWQARCGIVCAVLEIRCCKATDIKYIPVSVLRAPCIHPFSRIC